MLFPLLAEALDETDVSDRRFEVPNRRLHSEHHLRSLDCLRVLLQREEEDDDSRFNELLLLRGVWQLKRQGRPLQF